MNAIGKKLISHLKDFRGRDKESKSRGQAGCKYPSSDEVVETRNLAQDLVWVIIKYKTNQNKVLNTMNIAGILTKS